MFYQFDVSPVASPRMTRSDKWKIRPIVASYRYFKDKLREEARKAGFNIIGFASDVACVRLDMVATVNNTLAQLRKLG